MHMHVRWLVIRGRGERNRGVESYCFFQREQPMRLRGIAGCAALTACVATNSCAARPATHGDDSAGAREDQTARSLYALVLDLDSLGRIHGELPAELSADLPIANRPRDRWGRTVRFTPSGLRFELRSAGGDGIFGTGDDIVAAGQVGRNRPCEMVIGPRIVRWDEFAPRCSPEEPVRVYPTCPQLVRAGLHVAAPSGDGVASTGLEMVGIAWRIDGESRQVGGLIPTLRPVLRSERIGTGWGFIDAWGNPLLYTGRENAFELRSAGPDGLRHTDDDIIVDAVVGQVARCEYRIGSELHTCEAVPPACPER
jgi:hypothetical protein